MRLLSRPLPRWALLLCWGPGTAVAQEPSYCEDMAATGRERGHEVEHRPEGMMGGVAGGVAGGTILCPLASPSPRELPPEFHEEVARLLQSALSACLGEGGNPTPTAWP
jgi:hypothetical protein